MSVAIIALLLVMLISTLCGWWMIRRKTQDTPVKIMMFIGYFWLLTFLQLFLLAAYYFIGQRFSP
ncbi:hypothetical protein NP590_16650 [Methylomonas sp. SURF-2]|uniref:Uncharacterized protein n=1 Tax=Methylomonas subterranea TaxID=2952225 RepID=A0ABT1TJT7_9GAMM|nr:hypothetical protein [Methylomonas sp. SURF-2]MCQ8105742.1 hypothetical protein [Methylomonas sp. SURF-2]